MKKPFVILGLLILLAFSACNGPQRTGLESLNLQGLAAGTYTMRVTLEGGKAFSDKVVKE